MSIGERENSWRMVKARRKRVQAAEEKAAAETKQAAREEGTASEREGRELHSQTRAWQRIHKRGMEVTEEQEGQQQQ